MIASHMTSKPKATLEETLLHHEQSYGRYARNWKLGYRLLLVTSALFSTGAAVIGKLVYFKIEGATDIAAILAGITAVITTLIAALDFEANWLLNRKAKHDVTAIILESKKSTATPDASSGESITRMSHFTKLRSIRSRFHFRRAPPEAMPPFPLAWKHLIPFAVR